MTRADFSEVAVVAAARSCSCHWSDCVCQDTRADIMLPRAGLSLVWILFVQPFEFHTRALAHGLSMLQSHSVFIDYAYTLISVSATLTKSLSFLLFFSRKVQWPVSLHLVGGAAAGRTRWCPGHIYNVHPGCLWYVLEL